MANGRDARDRTCESVNAPAVTSIAPEVKLATAEKHISKMSKITVYAYSQGTCIFRTKSGSCSLSWICLSFSLDLAYYLLDFLLPFGIFIFSHFSLMLQTIAAVLLVLWVLGLVSSYTMGGFIHILLVVAIVLFLVRVIRRGD